MKLFTVVVIFLLLSACASIKKPNKVSFSSLNVAVQNEVNIARSMAEILFINQARGGIKPNKLDFFSFNDLIQLSNTGNSDVSIGLIRPLIKNTNINNTAISLLKYRLTYLLTPDKENSHGYAKAINNQANEFFSKMQSIGIVSDQRRNNDLDLIISNHEHKYLFTRCGILEKCLTLLLKGEIGALAMLEVPTLNNQHNMNKAKKVANKNKLVVSKFSENYGLGAVLNSKTLGDDEQLYLSDLILKRYINSNLKKGAKKTTYKGVSGKKRYMEARN